ncbi:recombinase zinc beta ribbon domain-containing protein [Streptomyces aureocirculatus]|uniref:recombinase zinc beta ribbon domain-containing protein n=1 Tax=Streptomyces aureocirculatus TaxID=67275 RepID=UPI00099C15BB|nr:recombinase family protein [Streptomyces aureocirculatus]
MARLTGYLSRRGGLHPEEAKGLRKAASLLFDQQARAEVCRWMNAQGHRTTRGNEWAPEVLTRVLSHPRMAGLDDDGQLITDFGETVLTPDERLRLLALFTEQAGQQAEPREAFDYLMKDGLSECDRCAHSMVGARVTSGGAPTYRCPPPRAGQTSCGRVRINGDRFEDTVAEEVLAELLRPGTRERVSQLLADLRDEAERLRAHVEGAEKRFGELREMREMLVPAAYEAAEKATNQDLREARSRLRYLEQLIDVPIDGVEDLAAWWKTAPRAWQRALLGVVIVKVRVLAVGRGRHRDPSERIRIEWR